MDFDSLIGALTPETYQRLADAVATGRWPDGKLLSEAQRSHSMQLVMAYQAKILKSDEPFTIGADGQMVQKSKAEQKAAWQQQAAIARFDHDDL